MIRRFGSNAVLSCAERQTLAVLDPLRWLSCATVRHRVALQRATDSTVRRRRRHPLPPERISLDLLGLHSAGLVERCSHYAL